EKYRQPQRAHAQRDGYQQGKAAHLAALARRSELATTTSELRDMAIAAISGVTSPASASGTATTLYNTENPRFWRTIRIVARDTRTASATGMRPPPINTASAACWLT